MVEEAEWGEDDAEDNEVDKGNKDNGERGGREQGGVDRNFELMVPREVNSFITFQP